MAEQTGIAWAHSTFNPWIGCTKVAPECDNCYAERLATTRLQVPWGSGEPRRRTKPAYWAQPYTWNRKARESGQPWRVFCASLADVFDNEVDPIWRHDLWKVIRETPHLTWMLLTKRVGNVPAMLPRGWVDSPSQSWPNVWLGITCGTQAAADRDIPKLLAIPAAVRWLSIEPMLEPVSYAISTEAALGIDWVIYGLESNQGFGDARRGDLQWIRDGLLECRGAGASPFVKQMGPLMGFKDRSGADPAEWPADLRVREFPQPEVCGLVA